MPIAIACGCGKTGRVKDELAGKKVRCPECREPITVPRPADLSPSDEGAFQQFTSKGPPRPKSASTPPPLPDLAIQEKSTLDFAEPLDDYKRPPKLPRKRSVPYDSDIERKPERPTRGIAFEEGWFGSIDSGMIGGLLMIVIAVVWFGLGLAAGRIFFYPPILLVIGVISMIKGMFGGE